MSASTDLQSDRPLLTIGEVASELRVSTRSVRRLGAAGRLESIRLGHRTVRYTAASVAALLDPTNEAPAGNGRPEKESGHEELAEVFHAEYRRLTSGGRGQDEDVREDALVSALGAVEEAVREQVAQEVEALADLHEGLANFIRNGASS